MCVYPPSDSNRRSLWLINPLVSPKDHNMLGATHLALTGRIGQGDKCSGLRSLASSAVSSWADEVRKGSFIIPTRYFTLFHTLPVLGYTLLLNDLDSIASSQPTLATETLSCRTSAARPSDPHTLHRRPLGSVEGITELRIIVYRNYRGVAMDP